MVARLGPWQGVAVYVGSVLGPGVLVLPRLAADAAGPASLVAWGLLLAFSVPVAATFAALGARFPDGGGVSTFVRHAFGPRAAAAVGWWFYLAIPPGVVAGALIGAGYVAGAAGFGGRGTLLVAVGLLAVAFAVNHRGLRLSGRAQLALTALLVVLLVVASVAAAGHLDAGNFTPFAPHGAAGVLDAVGVLFFAFLGWEAASHLSAEFADPARDLRRVTAGALAVVAVLYLGLSIVSIGALGEAAATEETPLAALLAIGLGPRTGWVTAAVALVLSFGAINAYIAGASRLGAALGRDRVFPAGLARGSLPGQVPHRSLAVLGGLTALALLGQALLGVGVEELMRVTVGFLAAVTTLGCAAAIRLLPKGGGRRIAIVATAFSVVPLASVGWFLVFPAALAAVAWGRSRRLERDLAVADTREVQ